VDCGRAPAADRDDASIREIRKFSRIPRHADSENSSPENGQPVNVQLIPVTLSP
jgi:hypothetical protein